MKLIRNRNRRIAKAAIIALIALLTVAGPYVNRGTINAYQESSTDNGESLPTLRDVVRLSWDHLPAPDAVTVGKASRVMLGVANLTSEPMRVEIRLTADDGGQQTSEQKLGDINLDSSATKTIPVDLRKFGIKFKDLKYSGQLEAIARAFLRGETNYRQTDSRALYFHPANASASLLSFYGEQALIERFNSGDFKGRISRSEIEPDGVVTSRVIFGGAGSTDTRRYDEPDEIPASEELAVQESSQEFPGGPTSVQVSPAAAHSYKTYIKFQIRTVDSGVGIPDGANAGGTEDHYLDANNDISAIARGVRVKVSRGGWEQTFDADPTNGSFTWSHTATNGFSIRVYGYATDSAGNYVRIHNSPSSFTSYPGQTYSILLTNVSPTAGGSDTYHVGSYDSKWTAMATLAFGLYRFHDGLSDKAFHVGIDNTQADGASAHYGQSNSNITEGRHYIKLGNGDVDADGEPATRSTKFKFIVTHELGHAIAALHYGDHADADDGKEPNVILSHFMLPDACFDLNVDVGSYSIATKEWNSVGFREGFAHFISAKIWNNKETEGTFTWFAQAHDLERYNFGASNNPGGRLENQCCVGGGCAEVWAGAGTNEDWVRFLWDWYTNTSDSCPDRPAKLDMLKLYRQVRLNGGLTMNNYFEKMQAAADDLTHLSDCLRTDRFNSYADHNGINNQ
jgi:hypothetical protein